MQDRPAHATEFELWHSPSTYLKRAVADRNLIGHRDLAIELVDRNLARNAR